MNLFKTYSSLFYLKSKRGLSLIEVIYSIVLLAVVLVLLSQISSQSTTHLKKSERYYLVSHLIENKLVELETEYKKEGPSILKEVEKEVFQDHPDFSWSLEIQPMNYISPELLKAQQETSALGISEKIEQLNQKFTELITEARITIHYNKGSQPAEYSLTSYFIDFEKARKPDFLADITSSLQNMEKLIDQ